MDEREREREREREKKTKAKDRQVEQVLCYWNCGVSGAIKQLSDVTLLSTAQLLTGICIKGHIVKHPTAVFNGIIYAWNNAESVPGPFIFHCVNFILYKSNGYKLDNSDSTVDRIR
jgi:hypothetical protein